MNLTFGICWIEDQASDAEVEAVANSVRAHGFEPEIKRVETEDDIRDFAQRQENFHDYDLILLDLRLGGGLRGDELAPDVRRKFRSTPILFYSAVSEADLRRMMADKVVEGAYCAHRDRLPMRIGELVSNLSPALNRLSGMRGLAARVVADCDQELRAILIQLGHEAEKEAAIISYLKDKVRSENAALLEKIDPIDRLSALLDDHSMSSGVLYFAARDKIRAMDPPDDIKALLRAVREYPNDVIARRNTLAHALEERTNAGWRIVRRGTASDLTIEDFQRFRSDFLSNLRNLRRLRELLVSE